MLNFCVMKKTIIIFSICFFTAVLAFGQKYDINFPVRYNQDAHYPKGDTALMMYFLKNIKYTDEALKNEIRGTAMFSVMVMPDSSITEIIPLSKIGYGIEEQVAGLIKKLRYAPAVINWTSYSSSMILYVDIYYKYYNAEFIEK